MVFRHSVLPILISVNRGFLFKYARWSQKGPSYWRILSYHLNDLFWSKIAYLAYTSNRDPGRSALKRAEGQKAPHRSRPEVKYGADLADDTDGRAETCTLKCLSF